MKRWQRETRDVLAVLALGAGAALGPFTSADGEAVWRPQQHDVLPSPERATEAPAMPKRTAGTGRESLGVCLQEQPVPAPIGYGLVEAGTGTAVDRRDTSPFLICDGWGDPLGVLRADAYGWSEPAIRPVRGARSAGRVRS